MKRVTYIIDKVLHPFCERYGKYRLPMVEYNSKGDSTSNSGECSSYVKQAITSINPQYESYYNMLTRFYCNFSPNVRKENLEAYTCFMHDPIQTATDGSGKMEIYSVEMKLPKLDGTLSTLIASHEFGHAIYGMSLKENNIMYSLNLFEEVIPYFFERVCEGEIAKQPHAITTDNAIAYNRGFTLNTVLMAAEQYNKNAENLYQKCASNMSIFEEQENLGYNASYILGYLLSSELYKAYQQNPAQVSQFIDNVFNNLETQQFNTETFKEVGIDVAHLDYVAIMDREVEEYKQLYSACIGSTQDDSAEAIQE